jgi:hypothetical protein
MGWVVRVWMWLVGGHECDADREADEIGEAD